MSQINKPVKKAGRPKGAKNKTSNPVGRPVGANEKLILGKVIADKVSMDVTSGGQSLVNNFNFQKAELPEWTEPALKIIDASNK